MTETKEVIFTKANPYLALTGELWCAFSEDLGKIERVRTAPHCIYREERETEREGGEEKDGRGGGVVRQWGGVKKGGWPMNKHTDRAAQDMYIDNNIITKRYASFNHLVLQCFGFSNM